MGSRRVKYVWYVFVQYAGMKMLVRQGSGDLVVRECRSQHPQKISFMRKKIFLIRESFGVGVYPPQTRSSALKGPYINRYTNENFTTKGEMCSCK